MEKRCIYDSDCERQKAQCYENNIKPMKEDNKKMWEELKKFQISMIQVIAEMPEKIIRESESKFASKATEAGLIAAELATKKLGEKMEERNYEWLKYLITAGIGALISALFIKLK